MEGISYDKKEHITPDLLEEIGHVLKIPLEAIKNFDDQSAYNIIGNTAPNTDNIALVQNYQTFNPIAKLVDVYEENKNLCERLLQVEKKR